MVQSAISTQQGIWNPGHFKVFISHRSRHKAAAEKLRTALLTYNVSSFVAHTDIEPTKEWENEILSALRSADALVALLHKGFHASKWTDQETGIAIGRGLLTISVTFGEAPYGFIGRYQALPGRGKSYARLAGELWQILLTHPQSRRRVAELVVTKFVESASFDEARSNSYLLETLEYWDEDLTKTANEAVKVNNQLSEAWGVPERLKRHIRRWKRSNRP